MEMLLTSTFPKFTTTNPNRLNKIITRVSIKPPPPDFDFRSNILHESRSAIAKSHPELLDLADNGTLVMLEKRQFGPVPGWRAEFVEPEVIWLVGTRHVGGESAEDVARVVRAVRPDNVVVELCRSRHAEVYSKAFRNFQGFTFPQGRLWPHYIHYRTWGPKAAAELPTAYRTWLRTGPISINVECRNWKEFIFRAGIMYASNDGERDQQRLRLNIFSLSGNGFFGAVGRSLNLGGQTALALRLLLALFSSKISSDVNHPFGDEFRMARKTSEEIGAQIVLGDRPIEITLERAWKALKWNEKLSLVTAVVRGITSSSDMSESKLKESDKEDNSFQLYEQLSFSYPSLLQPLIHERDTYLAWSLKRSKAVNNGKRVVGVIGKGHMNGVIYALISDLGDLRFRDLCGDRASGSNGWIDTLVKNLVKDTLIGIVLWALYEQLIKPRL